MDCITHRYFNFLNILGSIFTISFLNNVINSCCVVGTFEIDHFTVVGLVPQPPCQCEARVDLVLMQTPFVFLWKLC